MPDKMTYPLNGVIPIGHTGENEAREIAFDISALLRQWPGMTPHMIANRPGETDVYPCRTRVEGNVIIWEITDSDTAKAGQGEARVVMMGENGEVGKSRIVRTQIDGGMEGEMLEVPPSAIEPYVLDVMEAADRAEDAAKRAEEIAEALAGGGSGDLDSGLFLPSVNEEDNGKVLTVVGGKWAAAELPTYDGAYEVTPLADESTTLLTAQKFMDSNVVVSKVPYYETSNTDGGETVYIATEVDIYGD